MSPKPMALLQWAIPASLTRAPSHMWVELGPWGWGVGRDPKAASPPPPEGVEWRSPALPSADRRRVRKFLWAQSWGLHPPPPLAFVLTFPDSQASWEASGESACGWSLCLPRALSLAESGKLCVTNACPPSPAEMTSDTLSHTQAAPGGARHTRPPSPLPPGPAAPGTPPPKELAAVGQLPASPTASPLSISTAQAHRGIDRWRS